jgi:G:T-mismatch repair DNA endonuclease (very short patch repair protein)
MRIKECEICGKKIYGTPKEFEKKRYCSFACKIAGMNKTMTNPHRIICDLLNKSNIYYDTEYPLDRYLLDIFLSQNNLGIEIMGTFWHCDIRFFDSNIDNKYQLNSFKRDNKKNKISKEKNISILYLWEYDIENEIDICEKLIYRFIENNGMLDNYHSMNYRIQNMDLKLNEHILVPYFEK